MYQLKTFLADLRTYWGFTQKEVADKSGLSEDTISQWERGVRNPNPRLLGKLNTVYGFDVVERFYSRKMILEKYDDVIVLFEKDPSHITNPDADKYVERMLHYKNTFNRSKAARGARR